MSARVDAVKAIFRGINKLMRSYQLEIGPVRAQGIPALLIAVGGIVVAGGVASALSRAGSRLPETLREAQGLASTLRGEPRRLNP
jgi:hypothetical protein